LFCFPENKAKFFLNFSFFVLIFFIVFGGSRCEKHKKLVSSLPSGESHKMIADAGGIDGEIMDFSPEEVDFAGLDENSSEETLELADIFTEAKSDEHSTAEEKIVFKKIPRIPAFKPWIDQPIAGDEELEYLTDIEKTCKILREGEWAKAEGAKTLTPMKRVRVADGLAWRFQILLALKDMEKPITAFFKPRQINYWDWLKEIHAARIGELINAPIIPTVMRFFEKKRFSWWLSNTPPEETTMFEWEGKKEPKIRGALKYWVPSYVHRRFGMRIANEEYMNEIAESLHPANKEKLEKEFPLYLELGRGIVFDYLILNEDRPENLGTILLKNGSYKLVLIDNGLSLGVEHGGRTVMKKMFKKMRLFPKDMIEKIRSLEKSQIQEILRPADDPVMWLPEICITQFFERRDDIISTVDKWHEKWGDIIWY